MIAIVDDDEDVRVATENLILSYGLDAHTFSSAEAFLASPCARKTDCVITDVQMPGMSGLDLQTTLRQLGCDVPMVFVTAFPEERVRRRTQEAGAIGFLSKPFDGDAMMGFVFEALKGQPIPH